MSAKHEFMKFEECPRKNLRGLELGEEFLNTRLKARFKGEKLTN